jgi:ubiquinone/menaquinone biosynthesis C-methylase UbiE
VQPTGTSSFDDLATAYRRYRLGYAPELYAALEEFGIARGAHVLDVGCGTGLVSHELARRGCRITGVDVSGPMLDHARELVPEGTFVEAAAEALPFEDATFDAAVSAQAFHWFDQAQALEEMARVVRPGGTVAVWWKGMMRGDATRLIRESVARELGLVQPPDLLTPEFAAFETSPLVDRRIRIIPWIVAMTVERYIGYECSRARAPGTAGEERDAYLAALERRLGSRSAELSISYINMLYLGRVPERS